MHTLTIVLLPRDTPNLWQAGSDLLKPHRLDWDDVDRPSRLDYWTVGGESIADPESAAALGVAGDADLARNCCEQEFGRLPHNSNSPTRSRGSDPIEGVQRLR